jgi:hypothetical protein
MITATATLTSTISVTAILVGSLANVCAVGNIKLNSTQVSTVPSGGTEDLDVVNSGANPVGAWDGSSFVIGNNATFINSVQVTDQPAEEDASIEVVLDGSPSGSWNSLLQRWEVISNVPTPKTTGFVWKTGETNNYGTGSDGQVQSGDGVSWLVMSENNMFGNTNRFTDTLGGQTYANNIVLVHSTRNPLTGQLLGYDRSDVITARTWANHLAYFATKAVAGYTLWRPTNYNELHEISRWGGVNFKWSNAPFSYTGAGTGDYLWCGTTNHLNQLDAWLVFNYSTVPVQSRNKTGSYFMMGCRTFTLTDGGVLS